MEKTIWEEDRTEGWIAGLQFAALAMQGHQDVLDPQSEICGNSSSQCFHFSSFRYPAYRSP
jgi:hypothetical protein